MIMIMKSLLVVSFLLFSYCCMDYWSFQMSGENEMGNIRYLIFSTFLVEIVCVCSILNHRLKNDRIVYIFVSWAIFILLSTCFNGGSIFLYIRLLYIPLLFLGVYNISFQYSVISSYQKLFFLVLCMSAMMFLDAFLKKQMEGQTNTIYFLILTLPWMLTLSDKKKKWLIFSAICIAGLLSFKRSVFLIVASTLLFLSFSYFRDQKGFMKKIFLFMFVISIAILAVCFVDNISGGFLVERLNREETDEGRNRLAIWQQTWSMISSSSMENLIVGHGHYGVSRDSFLQISAHNDFLEIIYDYGLLVFSVYLLLWQHVIRTAIYLVRHKSDYAFAYMCSLFIFFFMSLVSHLVLYSSFFMFVLFFWSYIASIKKYDEIFGTNRLTIKK